MLYLEDTFNLYILLQVQYEEFVVMMSRPGDEPMERKLSEVYEAMTNRLEDMKRRRSSTNQNTKKKPKMPIWHTPRKLYLK